MWPGLRPWRRSLLQVVEPDQFKDSLYIDEYARSGVTACQMAGIVKGYDNGFFQPDNTLTREECAAVVYRVMTAADMEIPEGQRGGGPDGRGL